MPISRKKACLACSRSKLRCNRSWPTCSRCTERQLSCIYDSTGQRPILHSPTTAPLQDAHTTFNQSLKSRLTGLHQIRREPPASSTSMGLSDFTESFMDWGYSDSDWGEHRPTLSPSTPLPASKDFNMPVVQDTPDWPSYPIIDNTDPTNLNQQLIAPESEEEPSLAVVIPNNNHNKEMVLTQRPFTRGTILSSIILGQLTSYPKMLIQGDILPPFIHPPCFRDERLAPGCSDKGQHVCLPEELAMAQSLVRSFYSRTANNTAYVWRSIYAEKERLKNEVST